MIDPAAVFRFTEHENDEATWRAEPGCPYFEGHFPGMPVLPAVALLDGTLELLRLTGVAKLSLRKAKFTGMVVPGMEVRIRVSHKPDRIDVDWRKKDGGDPLATFTFPR